MVSAVLPEWYLSHSGNTADTKNIFFNSNISGHQLE